MGHFSRECRQLRNQDSRSWNKDSSKRTVNIEEIPPKAMVAIDGVCFNWSYLAEDEVPTNMALMAFFRLWVNTARPRPVNTVRPRPVNTARRNSSVVNVVKANQGTCPISHISRNSIEDMLPLGEEQMVAELLILLRVPRRNNMYSVDMKNIFLKESLTCLVAKATLGESMLWHRRLGHINFKNINKLVKDNPVRGLPSKRFENDQTCVAYLKGKQHKASSTKDETSGILKKFITEIENLVDKKVKVIRCDNGTEFKNSVMNDFCAIKADNNLPSTFWAEAVNTACYVHNMVLVVKPHNKTPYELFRGRTHALSFMKPFRFHVTILNTLDHLGKFDGKSDEGFFVGYSLNSKAFRVYNIRTRKVKENVHIRFLEDKPSIAGNGPKWLFDIDVLTNLMNYLRIIAGTNSNDFVDGLLFDSSSKNATNDEPQSSYDARNKDDNGVNKDSGIDAPKKSTNSINDVNTVGPSINTSSTDFDTGSLNINIVSPIVSTASPEATHADFLGDKPKGDMSNINTTYQVPSTPNTRTHKDHSLDLVISDV
nr:hypothetical protein [Tanacetum cinerariifolium]